MLSVKWRPSCVGPLVRARTRLGLTASRGFLFLELDNVYAQKIFATVTHFFPPVFQGRPFVDYADLGPRSWPFVVFLHRAFARRLPAISRMTLQLGGPPGWLKNKACLDVNFRTRAITRQTSGLRLEIHSEIVYVVAHVSNLAKRALGSGQFLRSIVKRLSSTDGNNSKFASWRTGF